MCTEDMEEPCAMCDAYTVERLKNGYHWDLSLSFVLHSEVSANDAPFIANYERVRLWMMELTMIMDQLFTVVE